MSANNMTSEPKTLTYGVPQGSVLGQPFFLLYMLPLGKLIQQFSDVSYRFFADDIQVSLSNYISRVKQWLSDSLLADYCPSQCHICY